MINVIREKRKDVFLREADIRKAFEHMGEIKEIKALVEGNQSEIEEKTYVNLHELLNSKDKIKELKVIS